MRRQNAKICAISESCFAGGGLHCFTLGLCFSYCAEHVVASNKFNSMPSAYFLSFVCVCISVSEQKKNLDRRVMCSAASPSRPFAAAFLTCLHSAEVTEHEKSVN